MNSELIQRLAGSRKRLAESLNYSPLMKKEAEEGGCGVVGFCCSEPVAGRHSSMRPGTSLAPESSGSRTRTERIQDRA